MSEEIKFYQPKNGDKLTLIGETAFFDHFKELEGQPEGVTTDQLRAAGFREDQIPGTPEYRERVRLSAEAVEDRHHDFALQNIPPRTQEGKALRDAFQRKTVMQDVDYAKLEQHVLVNTGGESVSIIQQEHRTHAQTRKEQIKAALDKAPPGFVSTLTQLKDARRSGGNRRQRRRIEVVTKQLSRVLNKAGITLAEALELV